MKSGQALELLGGPAALRRPDFRGLPCAVSFDQRGFEASRRLWLLPRDERESRQARALRARGVEVERVSRAEPGRPAPPGLRRLLSEAAAIHPVRAGLSAEGLLVRFLEPVPWPHFIALDLAKPFAAAAPALCARLGGLRVDRLLLADGRMEVRVV